jgi:hypothetical protein
MGAGRDQPDHTGGCATTRGCWPPPASRRRGWGWSATAGSVWVVWPTLAGMASVSASGRLVGACAPWWPAPVGDFRGTACPPHRLPHPAVRWSVRSRSPPATWTPSSPLAQARSRCRSSSATSASPKCWPSARTWRPSTRASAWWFPSRSTAAAARPAAPDTPPTAPTFRRSRCTASAWQAATGAEPWPTSSRCPPPTPCWSRCPTASSRSPRPASPTTSATPTVTSPRTCRSCCAATPTRRCWSSERSIPGRASAPVSRCMPP